MSGNVLRMSMVLLLRARFFSLRIVVVGHEGASAVYNGCQLTPTR